MGESCELEEGEMTCSADVAVVDLDVDLSYIDKKVQNVLGHVQKDFGEGALDLFGPKICDYGSFLHGNRHLPAVSSCQMSSLGNHAVQRFPNHLPGKNVVQKFQSLPTPSCKVGSNQDPQNYPTSGSLLAQAPAKVPLKKGTARIQGNDLSDHKPIRLRIKMGSEILSQKVARVCNDLGLDDSPNSPSPNCHDSSRMLTHTSLKKTSESPFRILQEMPAIPVPEDLLMSPLPNSLLLVKDKEMQYTLLYNQPVTKARKKPPIQTQKKFRDVLGCQETQSGKRRTTVDCIDAKTWNETSSIGEMKKKEVYCNGQRARDNSACGLDGASSIKDELTTKCNLQEGIKKDGESVLRVAVTKTNKIKVAGMHAVREQKSYSTKLQQNSSKNRFGDKCFSKMPFKDDAYIGHNSTKNGFDFAVAPSSTGLDLDNWAQCDSCETWRLLPFGLKPEQLPEKWLCSMQAWLPGMNHCGISEEETTNAVKSFHASEAHGPGTHVKLLSDASKADTSYQPLTSGSLPNPIEKNSAVNTLSQGVSNNILVDAAKPFRSNSHVFKTKDMKLPGQTPNAKATHIATDLGVPHNFIQDKVDQKAKSRSVGTGSQIKIKKKMEGDKEESDGSKHIKTRDGNKLARDIIAENIHWNQDLEWTLAEQNAQRHENDLYTLDVEQDSKKRLLAYKRKPEHINQPTTGSGSLCTKAHGRITSPVRKRRLIGYKQAKNGNNTQLFADGEEKEPSMEKVITTQISAQDFKAHKRNELFQADGSQEHQNVDASCRYFSGRSGQISGVETSSSSKVFGSHKSGRMYVEEVKASPVDSVSSCPVRSSCLATLASARGSISETKQDLKYGDAGSKIVDDRKPQSQDVNCKILSTTHPRNRKKPKPEQCKQNSKFGDLLCTSMKTALECRAGINNFGAITHETMDKSCQAANDILQEAEKLRKLADCFKSSGFDYECKEANFKAVLGFLLGASLLEMCSTENVEGGKMSHVEAYNTVAKLSESCAHEYEKVQEMAEAALAYKCTEVACMRVVYGRSRVLSGEWSELQKMAQMTPQGESPSSSASDVDNIYHQGLLDKSAKSKSGLSHVSGNLLPVARSQLNFVPLMDLTQSMNLAMEASAKSLNAFKAVSVSSEETKDGDCISAIKKVVDFSFHDVEALIQMIEVSLEALSSSRFGGQKC